MNKQKIQPEVVYKFLDTNGGFASLNPDKLTVHYTRASDFNDPFECLIQGFSPTTKQEFVQYAMKASEDDILWDVFCNNIYFMPKFQSERDKLRGNLNLLRDFINQVTMMSASHLKKSLPSMPYISCFSENKDWIPMWAHYAENHKGIVIGYAADHLPSLHKVRYRPERLKKRLPPDPTRKWVADLVLTKFTAWHHECEWRSFLPIGDPQNRPVDSAAIVEINMGIRTETQLRSVCLSFASEHPTCRLYQAEVHATKYAIRFAPVKICVKQSVMPP